MKYILNTKTSKLHIAGYCCYISGYSTPNYKIFNSENDARKDGGNSIGMCKICNNKREEKLKESERKR